MNAADVPVFGVLFRLRARERMFDALVLLGPVLVALIALLGRNVLTTALAACYVLAFVGYVGYRGIDRARK